MDRRTEILDRMYESGVIAVMRGVHGDDIESVGTALADGGVTALEITADTDDAAAAIRDLTERMADRPVAVGVGTVTDAATARVMLLAGAEFVVTPSLHEDVIRTANRAGVPVIPGIMTPTEAVRAYEAGADAIKVFPATTVGPDHLAALSGPLDVTVIPTGGITLRNGAEFLEAGAAGIGVGSALVNQELIAKEQWNKLQSRARAFVDLVESHRAD